VIPVFEIRILEDVTVETNLVLMKLEKPRTNNNHLMQNDEIVVDKKVVWNGLNNDILQLEMANTANIIFLILTNVS
jgi:hypothetical protein